MRVLFSGPIPWLLGGFLFAIVSACLWIAGSANVVDETGEVVSTAIVDGSGREQPLYRLWRGRFYAIPRLEGTIEVRCANGRRIQGGYVTGGFHTTIRVVGPVPCERIVEE